MTYVVSNILEVEEKNVDIQRNVNIKRKLSGRNLRERNLRERNLREDNQEDNYFLSNHTEALVSSNKGLGP